MEVDKADELFPFQQRDKPRRRDHALLGVTQPDERLRAHGFARFQLHLRLQIDLEPAVLNRLEQSSTEEAREADEIDEEQPRVIIAGFGRFGQITGRLLLSSGVKMVVLDHDPDHIETLRKFGMKVFYGDATRMDLLESAGAAKAEVLINAIDDPQTNLQLTEMVKEHFPHLPAPAMSTTTFVCVRQALKSRSVKPSKVR